MQFAVTCIPEFTYVNSIIGPTIMSEGDLPPLNLPKTTNVYHEVLF